MLRQHFGDLGRARGGPIKARHLRAYLRTDREAFYEMLEEIVRRDRELQARRAAREKEVRAKREAEEFQARDRAMADGRDW